MASTTYPQSTNPNRAIIYVDKLLYKVDYYIAFIDCKEKWKTIEIIDRHEAWIDELIDKRKAFFELESLANRKDRL